jgi:ABC-type antimicrobial peptide transport system permease subunit
VLKDGIVIATIGIAVGALAGLALSRLAGSYLRELQLPGPLPLIASAMVILAAAVSASLMPATRAAAVDTIQALRAD